MKRTKTFWSSIATGALVLFVGYLSSFDFALWPGVSIAYPLWPEGIHSDFLGMAGIMIMLVIWWVGSWAAWSALAYLLIRLAGKLRPDNISKQPR